MPKVFLGVGHGGKDPGAVGKVKEAEANLTIALKVKEELERHGVTVKMSRAKDEDDPLADVIKEATAFKPDIALDVHNNAGGGDGFEVFVQTNSYAAKSKAIATAVEKQVKAIGQGSRGIKTKKNSSGADYFGFLRQLPCPAVILEGFFVDSNDALAFDTVDEQQALGLAYAKGILEYFNVKYSGNASLYRVQVGAFANKASAEALKNELNSKGYPAFVTSK